MKTHPAIDVAHVLRDRGYFPEKQFEEREKSSSQTLEKTVAGGN
jgi:hypothetical protein